MSDLRITDAPLLQQYEINDLVKLPTGGKGNYAIQLSDLAWYVANKENLTDVVYVDTAVGNVNSALQKHIADKANPHQVTKAQVGLDQVNNTADLDKPVSNATRSAIIAATTDMATKTYVDEMGSLKADKATTLSGYGIIDAYTKLDVDTKVGAVSGGYFAAVDTLANLQAKTGMTTGKVAKVMSDPTATNNGDYYYNSTSWVKGYDSLTDAKAYTDAKSADTLANAAQFLDTKVSYGASYTTSDMTGSTLCAKATNLGLYGTTTKATVFNSVTTSVFNATAGTVSYRIYTGSQIANGLPVDISTYSYSGNFVNFATTAGAKPNELKLDKLISIDANTPFIILMQHADLAKFSIYYFTQATKPSTLDDIKFVFGLSTSAWGTLQKATTDFLQPAIQLSASFARLNDLNNHIDNEVASLSLAISNKKDRVTNIRSLIDDLHNPLLSVNIKLVGDSITWGTGASNTSDPNPRNGTLTDVRNTTDPISPSWANLLRQWLCLTYTDGQLVHDDNGRAYAENTNLIILSKEINQFTLKNTTFNTTFTSNEIRSKIVANVVAGSKEHLDIVNKASSASTSPTEFSFVINGTGFTLEHAVFPNGTPDTYYVSVYVDGVFSQKISLYASAVGYSSSTVTLPDDGKHTITIKNDGSQNTYLRLTGLKVNKRVRVANDGINGSTTYSWLNSVKLSDSIKRKDDYVIVQLGTNDRIRGGNNSLNGLAKNLRTIVDNIYTLSSNNAKVIMMSANAVTQDESATSAYAFNQRVVNNAVKEVADEKQVSFISNYAATTQLKIDGVNYLADGLHPNDTGHRAIFDNIKQAILNA